MIFNIQKCSIHDGDGIRTLVFFKGCPLRCWWCANPESQSYKPEIMESSLRCIGCGVCVENCPERAIKTNETGNTIDRTLCIGCHTCTENCFADSKKLVGKEYSIDELFVEIEKDRPFYSLYGGGVTFSGGEPLTFPRYLADIAKKCKENNIHVVVESCGYGVYDEFKIALPYIDSFFIDIKHIDPEKHRELTGKSNELILENVKRIAEFGIPIIARTPIVPGCNDSIDNIQGISKFISEIPEVIEYELLPYHNFGESKYKALGIDYVLKGTVPPSDERMRELVKESNQILKQHNKTCHFVKDNKKEIEE